MLGKGGEKFKIIESFFSFSTSYPKHAIHWMIDIHFSEDIRYVLTHDLMQIKRTAQFGVKFDTLIDFF
jgi:hypothetical protein